ncbi:hypothetical protein Syun_027764 [Stephania yunnanensis]|uniref:Uncharacterized protein n=1 Tax=Stephania yunnanensis TaxID=152371 RepID=A0AAP0ELN7_9MAGN
MNLLEVFSNLYALKTQNHSHQLALTDSHLGFLSIPLSLSLSLSLSRASDRSLQLRFTLQVL